MVDSPISYYITPLDVETTVLDNVDFSILDEN